MYVLYTAIIEIDMVCVYWLSRWLVDWWNQAERPECMEDAACWRFSWYSQLACCNSTRRAQVTITNWYSLITRSHTHTLILPLILQSFVSSLIAVATESHTDELHTLLKWKSIEFQVQALYWIEGSLFQTVSLSSFITSSVNILLEPDNICNSLPTANSVPDLWMRPAGLASF